MSTRRKECSTCWPGVKLTDLRVGEDHVDLESLPPTSGFQAFSDYDS